MVHFLSVELSRDSTTNFNFEDKILEKLIRCLLVDVDEERSKEGETREDWMELKHIPNTGKEWVQIKQVSDTGKDWHIRRMEKGRASNFCKGETVCF